MVSYEEFTKDTESPASYHRWVGLSCIAGALQRRVFFIRGHEKIYPNQFVVLVGPSGRSRKGLAIGIGRGLLETLNISMIGEDNSQESVIREMRESKTTFKSEEQEDPITQSAVTCIAEELAVFTGYQNATYLAYLTNWYDSRDKWTRKTKHQGTDEIIGMCFNLLAATAPDWLPHILTREAVGGGFTSRCIFVVEEDKGRTIADPNEYPVDEELRDALLHDLEAMYTISGTARWSNGANDLYKRWYEEEDEKLRSGHSSLDPALGGYISRRGTHVVKLAIALSAARGDGLSLEGGDFTRARDILEAAERNMSKVFIGIGTARFSYESETVAAYIHSHGRVSRSQILAAFHRNVDHESLVHIITTLKTMKTIKVKTDLNENEEYYESQL